MNTDHSADTLALVLEDLLRSLDQEVDNDDLIAVERAISKVMKCKTNAREALANFYACDEVAPPPKAEDLAVTAEEEAAWRQMDNWKFQ